MAVIDMMVFRSLHCGDVVEGGGLPLCQEFILSFCLDL